MLKVLTFNCQRAYQKSFGQYINLVLREKKYDFILLQEADSNVLDKLNKIVGDSSYNILCHKREIDNTFMQICIIYNKSFSLIKSKQVDFYSPNTNKLTESGAVIGLFNQKDKDLPEILVSSVHLEASFRPLIRKRELAKIKNEFLNMDKESKCIHIFGGDFNNIGPGEWLTNDIKLWPNLVNVTNFRDYTHDCEFLEEFHKQRKLAKFFFVHKLNYKIKIDHIYLDKRTHSKYNYQSKVIDVKASDHRPIELIIT